MEAFGKLKAGYEVVQRGIDEIRDGTDLTASK